VHGEKRSEFDTDATWRKEIHMKEIVRNGLSFPFVLNKTDVRCCNTSTCINVLANNLWCQSGLACIDTYCYRIPNYPCATQVETCDEVNHRCEQHACTANTECDDGVYCNGVEKCVNGFCKPGLTTQCNGGICDETTKVCSYPNMLGYWRTFSSSFQVSRLEKIDSSLHAWNLSNTTGGFPETWTIWVIAVTAAILFMVLVMLLVAMVNKNTVIGPVAGGTYLY
jgi:hypothetical protein